FPGDSRRLECALRPLPRLAHADDVRCGQGGRRTLGRGRVSNRRRPAFGGRGGIVKRFIGAIALLTAAVACGAATPIAEPPEFAPKDQTKCQVRKSQSRPLVVEWPGAD